jgi:hypothetical protein
MSGVAHYESNRPAGHKPFFSICIPQYNRTDFLMKACSTFTGQSFDDFEVCISDDCSNDNRQNDLLHFLRDSGLTFVYAKREKNLRYDGNLRSAIELSLGEYVWLMGNDDGLSEPDVLERVRDEIGRHQGIAAVITNYRELSSGLLYRRAMRCGLIGAGPSVAAIAFRNYAFLSGIVFNGASARQEATDACDGSEMYQMYLGTRLVAAGGQLLAIDRVCVDKDLQIPGKVVDSYRGRPKKSIFVTEWLPMGRLPEVVAAALEPYHSGRERERNLLGVCSQLYRYTYPFWVIEYRRIRSWAYALSVWLQLYPARVAKTLKLSTPTMFRLWVLYLGMGTLALAAPINLFDALRSRMYALAKQATLP